MTLPISRIDQLDMGLDDWVWPFIAEHKSEIDQNWEATIARSPRIFDGEVLLQHGWRVENGIYHGRYFKTRYRNFLGWRALGFPGVPVRNGFSMAALRSTDGAFLLGKMAEHTANPGMIYFAAGTPDLTDIIDGRVDLEANVMRELREETGLTADDVSIEPGWTLITDIGRAAFMRSLSIALPAEDARAEILTRMKTLDDDELVDIIIVRGLADIDRHRMPAFVVAYLEHMFREAA
jgi:8-oxo-dGTP pyrophosphatase MutT (NUDIX family)